MRGLEQSWIGPIKRDTIRKAELKMGGGGGGHICINRYVDETDLKYALHIPLTAARVICLIYKAGTNRPISLANTTLIRLDKIRK